MVTATDTLKHYSLLIGGKSVPSASGKTFDTVSPTTNRAIGRVPLADGEALPPGQLPMPGGLSLSVGTQLSAGQSTFQFGSSYARDEMVSWSRAKWPIPVRHP